MTLEALKEEYKKEVKHQQVVKELPTDDLDQMFEEIDEAKNLQDFVDVVALWSKDAPRIGAAMVILKRVVDLHDQ